MSPYELTCQAVAANEIDKLVLGLAPYAYFDRWTPASGPTDLLSVYQYGICQYAQLHPDAAMKDKIERLVPVLCQSSFGISAVNMIIFAEDYSQTHDQPELTLGLDTAWLKSVCRAASCDQE